MTLFLAAAIGLSVFQQPSQSPPVDHAATVRSFVAAFNAQDIDRMLALAAVDIEWISVDGAKIAIETAGKDALRKSMTAYFKSCPSCRSEVEIRAVTASRVAAIETASWTSAANGPRSQRGLSVYEFQDARIRRVYYYPAEK